jgi:hypothetical protein
VPYPSTVCPYVQAVLLHLLASCGRLLHDVTIAGLTQMYRLFVLSVG